jgi:tetratricopeptide (TPR) repeat protein
MWSSREAYLLALVCLLSGLVLGYLFHGTSPAAVPAAVSAASAPPAAGGPAGPGAMPTAQDLAPLAVPMLNALKVDPQNSGALIQLGNLYYDHQVYAEAISYYSKALEFEPRNVNVRTDLGTGYWYSGFPEKAVAEYEKSLAVDPLHANTLFNMGVVRLEGLRDAPGAAKYFEKVLKLTIAPEQRAKALELLARAKGAKP